MRDLLRPRLAPTEEPPSHDRRACMQVPFEYPVCFREGALRTDDPTLARILSAREPSRVHRVLFVVDDGLLAAWPSLEDDMLRYADAHGQLLRAAAEPVRVPGGERCKNDPAVLQGLYAALDAHRIDRHSFVVVAGGGAVLDAVGYAVATAHRGIRLVRMPSTVLAQGDSGVGVKNGVNLFGKKNFVGTFAPPFAVVNDLLLLRTLAPREVRAGLAEAVKVALLRDRSFFEWLHARAEALIAGDPDALAFAVRRSAELHLAHIVTGGDPFESGSSRPLDFGHWSAHKLEALTDHELRHGEAVALGMALDTVYSALSGYCTAETAQRVLDLLESLELPTWHDTLLDPRVLDGLDEFREHLGGELSIPLLRAVGEPVDIHAVDRDRLTAAVEHLMRREPTR